MEWPESSRTETTETEWDNSSLSAVLFQGGEPALPSRAAATATDIYAPCTQRLLPPLQPQLVQLGRAHHDPDSTLLIKRVQLFGRCRVSMSYIVAQETVQQTYKYFKLLRV